MTREELLACPFCGAGTVELHETREADMAWVSCTSCGLEAPSETGTSVSQAISYWNRRGGVAQTPWNEPCKPCKGTGSRRDQTCPACDGLGVIHHPAAPQQSPRLDLTEGQQDTLRRIANAKAAGINLHPFWQEVERQWSPIPSTDRGGK